MTPTDANPGDTVLYSLRDRDEPREVGAAARDAARRQAVPLYRGLSPAFLDALDALTEAEAGGWWRDALAHPDLILAVRREALDVYHRGASLYRVRFARGEVVADTHAKYLVRQGQTRVGLGPDGAFAHAGTPLLWPRYAGPETLAEMIRAARGLVGAEKTGVHALVRASANVVDLEIALAGDPADAPDEEGGFVERDGSGAARSDSGVDGDVDGHGHRTAPASPGPIRSTPRQDRIDVASLEERGHPGEAWLVFHEAKDFSNDALRAAGKRAPAIVAQMGRYRGSLTQNHGALVHSYPFVCQALVRLDALRRRVRAAHPDWADQPQPTLDPVIVAVADGTRRLRVETEPRLVVFGYDRAQKPTCEAECARLRVAHGLRVYAVGDPAAARVASAFRRPADVPLAPPPAPEAPPPDVIPLPPGAPAKPSLFFAGSGARQPVYLCNPAPDPMTAVRVESLGFTTGPTEVLHTGTVRRAFPEVPARAGLLVDIYDAMTDGDRLTPYTIAATLGDGARLCGSATVGKGGPAGPFVHLALANAPLTGEDAPAPAAASPSEPPATL